MHPQVIQEMLLIESSKMSLWNNAQVRFREFRISNVDNGTIVTAR
jgi:hypothetical protein